MVYTCIYCNKTFKKSRDFKRHSSRNKRSDLPNCPVLKKKEKIDKLNENTQIKVLNNESQILASGQLHRKFDIIRKYWNLHVNNTFGSDKTGYQNYKKLFENTYLKLKLSPNNIRYFKYFAISKEGLPIKGKFNTYSGSTKKTYMIKDIQCEEEEFLNPNYNVTALQRDHKNYIFDHVYKSFQELYKSTINTFIPKIKKSALKKLKDYLFNEYWVNTDLFDEEDLICDECFNKAPIIGKDAYDYDERDYSNLQQDERPACIRFFKERHPHHFAKYQNTLESDYFDCNWCHCCLHENQLSCPKDFEDKLWDYEKEEFKKYISVNI